MTTEQDFLKSRKETEAPDWVPRGSKCESCGRVHYPAKRICLTCYRETEMRPYRLSRRGTLYTFTVIHVGLEGFHPPYAVGWVMLPEGVRLFTPILNNSTEDDLTIGMQMEMILHPLPDEKGEYQEGFAFQPVQGEA